VEGAVRRNGRGTRTVAVGGAVVALALVVSGCGRKSEPPPGDGMDRISYADSMAADSAESARANAIADSLRAATAASVQSVRVRDWLDSALVTMPGVKVEPTDGPYPDHRTGKEADGAGLMIHGKFGPLNGKPDPTAVAHQRLQDAGWQEDIEYSADGPDGTTFAMRKDGILCYVEGRWDGGDGSDPNYVPPDDYTVTIQCTGTQP
jgi:hypothetical protein